MLIEGAFIPQVIFSTKHAQNTPILFKKIN